MKDTREAIHSYSDPPPLVTDASLRSIQAPSVHEYPPLARQSASEEDIQRRGREQVEGHADVVTTALTASGGVPVGGHDLVIPVLGDVQHVASAQMENEGRASFCKERVRVVVRVGRVHIAALSARVVDLNAGGHTSD